MCFTRGGCSTDKETDRFIWYSRCRISDDATEFGTVDAKCAPHSATLCGLSLTRLVWLTQINCRIPTSTYKLYCVSAEAQRAVRGARRVVHATIIEWCKTYHSTCSGVGAVDKYIYDFKGLCGMRLLRDVDRIEKICRNCWKRMRLQIHPAKSSCAVFERVFLSSAARQINQLTASKSFDGRTSASKWTSHAAESRQVCCIRSAGISRLVVATDEY